MHDITDYLQILYNPPPSPTEDTKAPGQDRTLPARRTCITPSPYICCTSDKYVCQKKSTYSTPAEGKTERASLQASPLSKGT